MSFSIKYQGSLSQIKKNVASSLSQILDLEESDIYSCLEQPLKKSHGHLALPVFSFSKSKKQNPKELAQEMTPQDQKTESSFFRNNRGSFWFY